MAISGNMMRQLLRDREIFLRDGDQVRRIQLPLWIQLSVITLFFLLAAFSGYAAARLATAEMAVSSYQHHEAVEHARLEERQRMLAALATELLDQRYAERVSQLEAMGIKVDEAGDKGGPEDDGDATFRELFSSWKKLDSIQDGAIAVPSDKPVKKAILTSGYGTRSDPFNGKARRHGGIDLDGETGDPIYATADGVVLRSGWNSGGYGNLVEIDHGRGIITRYGHLSATQVKEGDRVRRGQQIGKMGSTGRSSGSHLHYEVRIDGRAVNPIPFMRSADYLIAMRDSHRGQDSIDVGGVEE